MVEASIQHAQQSLSRPGARAEARLVIRKGIGQGDPATRRINTRILRAKKPVPAKPYRPATPREPAVTSGPKGSTPTPARTSRTEAAPGAVRIRSLVATQRTAQDG